MITARVKRPKGEVKNEEIKRRETKDEHPFKENSDKILNEVWSEIRNFLDPNQAEEADQISVTRKDGKLIITQGEGHIYCIGKSFTTERNWTALQEWFDMCEILGEPTVIPKEPPDQKKNKSDEEDELITVNKSEYERLMEALRKVEGRLEKQDKVIGEMAMREVNKIIDEKLKTTNGGSKKGTTGKSLKIDVNGQSQSIEIPSPVNNDRFTRNNRALLWHVRFGHASCTYLKALQLKYPQNKELNEAAFDAATLDCEVCKIAKFPRVSFPMTKRRATQPLEIIHSGTMGAIKPRTYPKGYSFISVFVDDYSGYAMAYPMRNKGETGHCLEKFVKNCRNLLGYDAKVCYLRSDQGAEYTSGYTVVVLQSLSAVPQWFSSDGPDHNNVSQRFKQMIQKKVRSYMYDAKLPENIWNLALTAVVHAYNRTPDKSHGMMTPLQRFAPGQTFTVDQIKRFGCLAYIKVPWGEDAKPVGTRVVLVGYTTSEYRFLRPEDGKYYESKHARFNEKLVYGDKYGKDGIKDRPLESEKFDEKTWFLEVNPIGERKYLDKSVEAESFIPKYKVNGQSRTHERTQNYKMTSRDYSDYMANSDYSPADSYCREGACDNQARGEGKFGNGAWYVKEKWVRCYECGDSGHCGGECPNSGKGPKCYRCNGFGHKAFDCMVNREHNILKRKTEDEYPRRAKWGHYEEEMYRSGPSRGRNYSYRE